MGNGSLPWDGSFYAYSSKLDGTGCDPVGNWDVVPSSEGRFMRVSPTSSDPAPAAVEGQHLHTMMPGAWMTGTGAQYESTRLGPARYHQHSIGGADLSVLPQLPAHVYGTLCRSPTNMIVPGLYIYGDAAVPSLSDLQACALPSWYRCRLSMKSNTSDVGSCSRELPAVWTVCRWDRIAWYVSFVVVQCIRLDAVAQDAKLRPEVNPDVEKSLEVQGVSEFMPLMRRCWEHKAEDRPEFSEIVKTLSGLKKRLVANAKEGKTAAPGAEGSREVVFQKPETPVTPKAGELPLSFPSGVPKETAASDGDERWSSEKESLQAEIAELKRELEIVRSVTSPTSTSPRKASALPSVEEEGEASGEGQ